MSEFKAGDRVTFPNCGEGDWRFVADDPTDAARVVVLVRGELDGCRFGVFARTPRRSEVQVIDDTVTVTVELPREEVEALAEEGRSPVAAAIDDAIGLPSRAYRRLRDAAKDAVA